MKILSLGDRFIIYLIEQSFLISLTSMVIPVFHIKAVFLGFFVAYKIDFIMGFEHIFDTYSGFLNILILFVLSFTYYSIETLTRKGIAENIFRVKVVIM